MIGVEVLFTPHAEEQIRLRNLDKTLVEQIVRNPQQAVPISESLFWVQARYQRGNKEHILRILCKEDAGKRIVITAYTTSRIAKYWRAHS